MPFPTGQHSPWRCLFVGVRTDDIWFVCSLCTFAVISYVLKNRSRTAYLKGYMSVLGIWSIFSPRWAHFVEPHLSSVLFTTWLMFAYRDLWPLATFTLQPADASEGPILWAKVGALTTAATVVPLLMPRTYIPYDPTVTRLLCVLSSPHIFRFAGYGA